MKKYPFSEYYVNRLETMTESCKEYMNKHNKENIKIEFGILPSDDFTDGGVEKAIIEQTVNAKITDCIIDDTINKINSFKSSAELVSEAGETYVLNWETVSFKGGIIKTKRKRKPKLRKK